MGGDRPNLMLAQVQVFCPGPGPGQDLTGTWPGLDLDLTWDLEWDLEWNLDLSLTIAAKLIFFRGENEYVWQNFQKAAKSFIFNAENVIILATKTR